MRLKAIRDAQGLTQTDLELLSGVPQPTISWLEGQPEVNPRWDTVCRLSYALNERPEALFGIPLKFNTEQRSQRVRQVRERQRYRLDGHHPPKADKTDKTP